MARYVRRPRTRTRVLIVAADYMTSELLTNALVHGRNDFQVVALTGTSHKVIAGLRAYNPHVALISDELQDGPEAGFKVLQKLRDLPHPTSAVMLLRSSKPDSVVSAFLDGARGVFCRTRSMKTLSKCIRAVHQGQIWAGNEDLEHLLHALIHLKPFQINNADGIPLLTLRQEDVVRLVADGLKNREIAQKLGIAEHSVRNYLYRIFEKLGVSSRVELILYAFSERNRGQNSTIPFAHASRSQRDYPTPSSRAT